MRTARSGETIPGGHDGHRFSVAASIGVWLRVGVWGVLLLALVSPAAARAVAQVPTKGIAAWQGHVTALPLRNGGHVRVSPATGRWRSDPVSATATEVIDLRPYANNAGISDDSAAAAANFDADGNSYSAQALQAAGVSAGQPITAGGVTFAWPATTPGQPDNVVAQGQVVTLTTPVSGTTLAFFGAADHGPAMGTGSVTYDDGSIQNFVLGFSDWTLNGVGGAQPAYGNGIAATTPYRNNGASGRETVPTYVFYAAVPLLVGKAVVQVTLPAATDQGRLHIFAMAVAPQSPDVPDQAQTAYTGGLSVRPSAHAAQTVTVGINGALARVALPFCTPIAGSVVDLTLRTVGATLRSATASITFAHSYSDCAWYVFTFEQPVDVTAGQVLLLEVEGAKGEAPLWGWQGGPGDAYPSGQGNWSGHTIDDFAFQTYVQPATTS